MRTVAIVGGGFCGTMTAVHLLRGPAGPGLPGAGLPPPLRVVLIERGGRQIGGVAYGTRCPRHVLNVPAGRMSALPDDPQSFVRWLASRDRSATGGAFARRGVYGEYLADVLAEAARSAAGCELVRVDDEALDLVPGLAPGRAPERAPTVGDSSPRRLRLHLAHRGTIDGDAAVLAIGNFPPSDPPVPDGGVYGGPLYARDPWSRAALDVEPDAPVLLVGTGLTMIDAALGLDWSGHRGPIHAISRRGLLPQAHRGSATAPPLLSRPADLDSWPPTAAGALARLRAAVRDAAAKEIDWREVVTSLRGDTAAIWARWPVRERRRFLEHLRPFWETHRHRAAPEAWGPVQAMIESGRLRVHAGRLRAFSYASQAPVAPGGVAPAECGRGGGQEGVRVEFTPRGQVERRALLVRRVVNCTGPEADIRRVDDPLIGALRTRGMIRADSLGLGIDSEPDGRAIGADGRVSPGVFLLGPLRKGALWENTAVPELRVEARELAAVVRRSLTQPAGAGRAGSGAVVHKDR